MDNQFLARNMDAGSPPANGNFAIPLPRLQTIISNPAHAHPPSDAGTVEYNQSNSNINSADTGAADQNQHEAVETARSEPADYPSRGAVKYRWEPTAISEVQAPAATHSSYPRPVQVRLWDSAQARAQERPIVPSAALRPLFTNEPMRNAGTGSTRPVPNQQRSWQPLPPVAEAAHNAPVPHYQDVHYSPAIHSIPSMQPLQSVSSLPEIAHHVPTLHPAQLEAVHGFPQQMQPLTNIPQYASTAQFEAVHGLPQQMQPLPDVSEYAPTVHPVQPVHGFQSLLPFPDFSHHAPTVLPAQPGHHLLSMAPQALPEFPQQTATSYPQHVDVPHPVQPLEYAPTMQSPTSGLYSAQLPHIPVADGATASSTWFDLSEVALTLPTAQEMSSWTTADKMLWLVARFVALAWAENFFFPPFHTDFSRPLSPGRWEDWVLKAIKAWTIRFLNREPEPSEVERELPRARQEMLNGLIRFSMEADAVGRKVVIEVYHLNELSDDQIRALPVMAQLDDFSHCHRRGDYTGNCLRFNSPCILAFLKAFFFGSPTSLGFLMGDVFCHNFTFGFLAVGGMVVRRGLQEWLSGVKGHIVLNGAEVDTMTYWRATLPSYIFEIKRITADRVAGEAIANMAQACWNSCL